MERNNQKTKLILSTVLDTWRLATAR